MKFLKKIFDRSSRKAIKKLPKIHRATKRLQDRYPLYSFGTGTYGLPEIHDWNEGSTLLVGAYTSIAGGVEIYLGGHHRIDWISCYPFPAKIEKVSNIKDFGGTNGDVVIGNDCWICSNVMILSGVTIGDGAVIAAGTVVSKNVPAYAVMAGNPARQIKWRFDEDTRKLLQCSAWWTWPESEIRDVAHMLCSNDLVEFSRYLEQRQIALKQHT